MLVSRTFNIDPESPYENEILYDYDTLTIEPGITTFVGCNGSGKTTLIAQIAQQLENDEHIAVINANAHKTRENIVSSLTINNNMQFRTDAIWASEGERLQSGQGHVFSEIGNKARRFGVNEVWVFLDSFDSGCDIANMQLIKNTLKFIENDLQPRPLYVIIAANAYEFARNERCLDVKSGNIIRFDSYEAYAEFIVASEKEKMQRYGKTDEE